jgi:hypothetical protein
VNKNPSYLLKFAFFLLQRIYPRPNREALAGDLLEKFSEGRSNRWLWRQVIVALGTVGSRQLRLILPEICVFAVAITVVCAFPWGLVLPLEAMDKPNGTEWIATMLSVDALTVLLVSPLFAALLISRNAFTWAHSLQIGVLTLLLLSGADALVREWALHHQSSHGTFLVLLQVFCISAGLLISTAFARRLSLQREWEH